MPRRLRVSKAQPLRLDEILPHLGNARQLPSGEWLASCPVPEHGQGKGDKNPSLSLRETPDGNLLVHCFAGCPPERVLEELRRLCGLDTRPARQVQQAQPQAQVRAQGAEDERGLTLQEYADAKRLPIDLLRQWHVSETRYLGKPALQLQYLAEDGSLIATQYRLRLHKTADGDERFRWKAGHKPQLYGLWRLPNYSGKSLWVCEGSSDAHSLWCAGVPAVSMPSASAKELAADFWRVAERFERIYLCLDADPAGQGLLEALAQACPEALRERACVVQLPDGVKDASELWLQVDADPDAFKNVLRECAERAVPLTELPRESEPQAQAQVLAEEREESIPVLPYTAVQECDNTPVLPNLLYEGAVSILAGLPASGKTTLALELACAVVEGGSVWSGLQLPQGAVVWCPYDHPAQQLRIIADQYYGEHPREGLYFVDTSRGFHEPLCAETYHRWRNLLMHLKPRLFVMDTLFHMLDVADELRDLEARQGMRMLRNLAEETGCAILALHHPRKANPEQPTTYALSGNLRWAAAADVLAFLHLIRREGHAEGQVARLTIAKNRFGQCPVSLDFERRARRFVPLCPSDVPLTEFQVVRLYLEQVGEARYEELLEALRGRGFLLSMNALRKRVQRWCERGLMVVQQRGFPRQGYVKLASVQLVNLPVETQLSHSENDGLNGSNGATEGATAVKPQLSHSENDGLNGANGATEGATAVKPQLSHNENDGLNGANGATDVHKGCEVGEKADSLLRNSDLTGHNGATVEPPVEPFAPFAPFGTPVLTDGATGLHCNDSSALAPPDVPDAELQHILEHRASRGEAHLAPLLAQVWELAKTLDFPRLAFKPAHTVMGCMSGYIALLKHAAACDLPLLLHALQQVSDARATAPAPCHTPDANGGGACLSVQPQVVN